MSDRDNARKHFKMLDFLLKYTDKDGISFDPAFTETIKTLKPNWFKESAPNNTAGFIKAFCGSGKTSVSYDAAFTKNIKTLAPHWFKG
jgi:hypothetical protein